MKVTEIEVCDTPQIETLEIKESGSSMPSMPVREGRQAIAEKPKGIEEAKAKNEKLDEHSNDKKGTAAAKAQKTAAAAAEHKAEALDAHKAQTKAKGPAQKIHFGRDQWSGYSYDELRLQLLLTRTRIELNRSMVMEHGTRLMEKKSRPVTMLGRMLGALDYLDYGVLAFKLGRTIFKLFRR